MQAVGHGSTVLLAPHVHAVRHGTPLKSGPLGWEPTLELPDAFAGNAGGGGERIAVYRTLTLARGQFTAGARYVLGDIQANGALVFEEREGGPYVAWSPTEIVLDAAAAALAAQNERASSQEEGEHDGRTEDPLGQGRDRRRRREEAGRV